MHFEEIINAIKERREMLKVTQEGLSELSGVGLRTIKQFESGKGNPTLQTLQKIADLLGLELTLKLKNIAGRLLQQDDGSFIFLYHNEWVLDNVKPSISLTLPKAQKEFQSPFLFPFFYNMLPEGSNKQMVCKLNRIDQSDYFGLLMTTAKNDSIGAVRVISE
jgi:serine/threonine-protein kinase HipA